MADLYRRAEAKMKAQQKSPPPFGKVRSPDTDPIRLLHELQVRQGELELQNSELQEARDSMEALLEKYTDLYEFAPVSYFSLDPNGRIQHVNLIGAHLAGADRSRLLGRSFGSLIAFECRPAFHAFLKQVFAGSIKRAGEFELVGEGQPPRTVNIEAQRLLNGQECRAVVVDITDRKRVEDEVRVSEVRYRRLFETAHDGVLLLDPVTRKITDANPFMTKLLGYSHNQLVGKELFEIGLLKDEVASQEMFQKLKRNREVRYEDLPLKSQKGHHQEVEVVANLYQENGHAVIQCNIRDITERKQTEAALILLAAIVESSDDAIIGRDLDGIITSWNKGAHQIFGYSADEMVGASIMRLIPNDRRDEEDQIMDKIQRGQSVQHFETLRKTKGGQLIHISITASPIKDGHGRIVGASKVARDISGRKQAEAALRASEERYRVLFELGPIAIYSCDASGKIQQFNRRAVELWGRRPKPGDSSERSCGFLKMFRPAGRPMTPSQYPMAQVLTGRKAEVRDAEVIIERPDGSRITVIVNIRPLKREGGAITGAINCFYDITQRKQAEDAQRRSAVLTASNRKLEAEILRRQAVEVSLRESEEHQKQLLADSLLMQAQLQRLSRQVLQAQEEERKRISRELHDVIAQTLTGINIRLATLKKSAGLDNSAFERNITRTQELVQQSVDKVHEFARDLRPTVLDDLGLIPALHSFMKGFTTRTGVRAHLTAFAGVEQLDTVKRTVLFRVAQEALTNVERHAHASRVDVTIHKLPHQISMAVKDDGKSFVMDRTTHGKGSRRLGLLGMRERLEMVGGQFNIDSQPGHGTTVTAQIPFSVRKTGGGGKRTR